MNWFLMYPPSPKDETVYDIVLDDGEIVYGVGYWGFGGCFEQTSDDTLLRSIPCQIVDKFRLSQGLYELVQSRNNEGERRKKKELYWYLLGIVHGVKEVSKLRKKSQIYYTKNKFRRRL